MSKLPVGYLDMGYHDYADLEVETLRAIFAELREIAYYTMSKLDADKAIAAAIPIMPVDWVMAVKAVKCECKRCHGSGTYYWGACINGKMSKSGPCARCGGDGHMTFDDMRRGRAYDNHAIARACR